MKKKGEKEMKALTPLCPCCKEAMHFIEVCYDNETDMKTAWSCECDDFDGVIYLIQFKEEKV